MKVVVYIGAGGRGGVDGQMCSMEVVSKCPQYRMGAISASVVPPPPSHLCIRCCLSNCTMFSVKCPTAAAWLDYLHLLH